MEKLNRYLTEKYQPQQEKEIKRRLVELSSLFEISQTLNASLNLEQVLNNLLLIPMGRLMISRGLVYLRNNGSFEPIFKKGIPATTIPPLLAAEDLPLSVVQFSETPDKPATTEKLEKELKLKIYIPLKTNEGLLGALFLGEKLNREPFTQDEINFLESLASISITSVENSRHLYEIQRVNRQLDERIQQLKTLFDINQGLSATLEAGKIIKLLSFALMGQMRVTRYAIVIFHKMDVLHKEIKGFNEDLVESLLDSRSELNNISSPLTSGNYIDVPFGKILQKLDCHAYIPIWHQNTLKGFILLGPKIDNSPFNEIDVEFLSTLTSQAIISLENSRLFQETIEKERMEQELRVAYSIQKKLLPENPPLFPGYQLHGINLPSKEVGGDYYDYFLTSEGKLVLCIADVSGKSIPAALLMANLQAGLHTLFNTGYPLKKIVAELNNLIHRNTELDKYITFFVAILDPSTHLLTYVNAGHNPPVLLRQYSRFIFLREGGIILGMMPNFEYEEGTVQLEKNDLLFCYTDGVNEAMNTEEEEFGEERMNNCLRKYSQFSSKEIADRMTRELFAFAGKQPQADDITMVILRREY
ncbi:MAG: hypothetical protein Kow0037_09610 [Calditrichia bacterium]